MWAAVRRSIRSIPVWAGFFIVAIVLALHVMSLAENDPNARRIAKPLAEIDTLIYDWRFQLLTPERPPTQIPIVIIDIDQSSISQEGRWPWGRDKIANLITSLQNQGAKLIGFDVVFSEPERNPVDALLTSSSLSDGVRAELLNQKGIFDYDMQLADVVTTKTVLGYFFHNDGVQTGKLPTPFLQLEKDNAKVMRTVPMLDYTGNMDALTDKSVAAGFVTTLPDFDGVIRRSPLILQHNNALYTSLAVEMAKVYLNASYIRMQTTKCRATLTCVESLQIGDHVIRTEESGSALVPYKGGRGSYPYVSATSVLQGTAPKGVLDGAIVIVGTSALGLADLRSMPLQAQYPGVEVHANLLDAILQSSSTKSYFPYRPDWEPGATFFILLVSGLIFALLLPRMEPVYMILVTVAWFVVLILGNFALWRSAEFDLPLAAILVMAILIAIFNIVYGFLRANHQKREIKTMFGQYVPAAHVDRMLASPEAVSLEGESREMSVLFSDVRDFTALSERLSAQELKTFLNRYFTPITEVIFENGGTIDKYVGDMVMAFWNAPLLEENHAAYAIAAALAMQKKADALSEDFVADGLPPVHIGVGINTGFMNVGDMGSEFRRAYTVIGDSVNLASRLEGLTKFYGVKVLVGESTYRAAPDYLYRLVDKILVKGKNEPVIVYEPICLLSEASESRKERAERYNDAVGYYFAQQWDAAESILRDLAAQDPTRILYKIFLMRIAELRRNPNLTVNWSGVYQHKSK